MAFLDLFRTKPKEEKRTFKRAYQAANTSRLFADFKESERSADSELYPVLGRMRARSRDLARNNEYVRRYLDLLKNNVVGDRGFSLQSRWWRRQS